VSVLDLVTAIEGRSATEDPVIERLDPLEDRHAVAGPIERVG
jgi:hypothetical protein